MNGPDATDAATFNAYSLHGAYVHRLFLPLVSTPESPIHEPRTSTWGPVARAAGIDLDAGTECSSILGWGRGDGREPMLRPSRGRAPQLTLAGIQRVLIHAAPVGEQPWRLRPFEATARHGEFGNRHVATDLDQFFDAWRDGPMPGALSLGNEILLDAPRYADSVIVSAPEDLTAFAARLGIEMVRAAPSRRLPDMTW